MSGVRVVTRRSTALALAGFVAAFLASFMYFWTGTGGEIPGIGDRYRVVFETNDVDNMVDRGDVSIAGVKVGNAFLERNPDDRQVRVILELDEEVAPLHEGVSVRIGVKSLVGASYVDVVDGNGEALPEGTTLPASAVQPTASVDDLLNTLDAHSRKALSATLRSLETSTSGSSAATGQLMEGLGMLGREGHTALDAIAAQSEDLKALTRETAIVLNALDSGRGSIAETVRDANRLTRATDGQRAAIEATMRRLPPLLHAARTATSELPRLSRSLAPVARDLKRAGPPLSRALIRLPAASADLRGLLPSLEGVLDSAPPTFKRVPPVATDVSIFLPEVEMTLRDLNPMLSYFEPYGQDLGALFANWGASMDYTLPNGLRPLRLSGIVDDQSIAGNPLTKDPNPQNWTNPYPAPGGAADPEPFGGRYPRVQREGE